MLQCNQIINYLHLYIISTLSKNSSYILEFYFAFLSNFVPRTSMTYVQNGLTFSSGFQFLPSNYKFWYLAIWHWFWFSAFACNSSTYSFDQLPSDVCTICSYWFNITARSLPNLIIPTISYLHQYLWNNFGTLVSNLFSDLIGCIRVIVSLTIFI